MVACRIATVIRGCAMKSIQRKANGERIGGLSGDAGSAVAVDPHFICGSKIKECTVELAGEAHLAR